MAKYRKRPVVIEAMQFTDAASFAAIWDWACPSNDTLQSPIHCTNDNENDPGSLVIDTLEGRMIANPGDWIIKGVAGEFYPCKPDIFEKSYEEA